MAKFGKDASWRFDYEVPIFIPSGGSGGPVTVEGSVVGDLRIFPEEAPH